MNKTPRTIQDLAHVFWMGGSPCSGKSSITELLSERTKLQYYSCDDAFTEHGKRVTALKQPAFHEVLHMTWDEIWMRPVEVQSRHFGTGWTGTSPLPGGSPGVRPGWG